MSNLPNRVILVLSRKFGTTDWEVFDIYHDLDFALGIIARMMKAWPDCEFGYTEYNKGQNTLVQVPR